jgi:excisionase family DNA binding protein
MTAAEKPWLTVPQMSEHYGISIATIRNWLKTGKLNRSNGAHRLGENWRINRSEFESKFMDSGTS